MQVQVSQLRRLMNERYEPTRSTPLTTHFGRFTSKEFADADIAERFHENTKYTRHDSLEFGESAALFTEDPSIEFAQAALEPDYAGRPLIDLPEPEPLDASLSTVLSDRRSRRSHAGVGLTRQALATLLGTACGVTGERAIDDAGRFSTVTKRFRSYASGGALYPVECYVAVVNGTDALDPGLYYYVPEKHALRRLRVATDDFPAAIQSLYATPAEVFDHAATGVTLFLTGSFWRTKAKYGPRGYRFVLQESGHLGQNLLLVAEAMGLAALPIASFRDDDVNGFLDIDGVNEAVVATLAVGQRTEVAA
ncbi:SagB/ThcOx family dehydrogenase [Haloferacaceae archaeon DSL9]